MKAERGHPRSAAAAQRVLARAGGRRRALAQENVFVCIRQRHGKGVSCAGSGSLLLLQQMQATLAAEGIALAELSVQPTGCLGLCKHGPAMVALSAKQAEKQKPARAAKHGAPGRLATHVKPKDLRPLLRKALARTWQPDA